MNVSKHRCYQCAPHDPDRGKLDGPYETLETTFADGGDEIFFASGYSAREIAQRHAREHQSRVFVNIVSRKIRRANLTVPVSYAVARSPVYTLCAPDEWHQKPYRSYWRPLD